MLHCLPKTLLIMPYLLPMAKKLSEANSCSVSQEILSLLRNGKVHYRVRKSPPPVPILNQIHPVHTLPSYFSRINFNIILPSTPRSSKWSLHLFSNQNFACMRARCPTHLILFDHRKTHGEKPIIMFFIMKSFPFSVPSSLLGPNILLRNLFSNTLNLCSSPKF